MTQEHTAEEVVRLTAREREVAALVTEGLSNDEIGERLVVSPGTAANHIEHIARKLELRGRTQIAVWVVEHGLYRAHLPPETSEGGSLDHDGGNFHVGRASG